ncbi:MAG: PilW family protein [Gammaproteobacteria bacterium]
MKTRSAKHVIDAPRQVGLSLVELMVALVIGLILTAGVISVYLTSKKSYSADTGLAQVQENGRFALSFLEPIVRMGGFMGCARTSNPTNLVKSGTPSVTSDPAYDFGSPVEGYDFTNASVNTQVSGSYQLPTSISVDGSNSDWTPNPPSSLFDKLSYIIPGSDILVVHEASASQYDIEPNPPGSTNYTQSSASGIPVASTYAATFSVGQLGIIADCKNADVFKVTDTGSGAGPIKYASTLSRSYGQGSQIASMQTYVFYIGQSPTDKSPALYQVSFDTSGANAGQLGSPVELVPDIENMQVLYGVDTSSDKVANQYVDADTVSAANAGLGEWGSVVTVRIALIARSDDFITDQTPATAQTFNLNGVTVTVPLDRRIRRQFVQTISLRNMLP